MKLSLWDSKTLLILLALGQGAALVYAGVALDGHQEGPLFWVALVRGVLVGFSVSFAASFAAHSLPRQRHKVAGPIGWLSLGFQVASSVVVIGICTVENPQGWLRWIVGPAYATMTDAAIVAVAMAGGKLFVSEEQPATTEATKKTTKKKLSGKIDPVVLVDKVKGNPKITNKQLAALFGVSPQAVQKHRAARQVAEAGEDGKG